MNSSLLTNDYQYQLSFENNRQVFCFFPSAEVFAFIYFQNFILYQSMEILVMTPYYFWTAFSIGQIYF